MDILLMDKKVTPADIQKLAKKIAGFHKTARVILNKDFDYVRKEFNDLQNEKEYLTRYLSHSAVAIIFTFLDR